jgi:hypothetical protein
MPSPYVSNYGITTVTASTTLTAAAHAGQTIVVDAAGGATLTLPAATGSGNRYTVTTVNDQTGDLVVQVVGNDVMQGVAYLGNDSAGASCFYTAATSDTVTLNGSTKGGLAGAMVELIDVAADTWNVMVKSEASGTEATPFSAAVT